MPRQNESETVDLGKDASGCLGALVGCVHMAAIPNRVASTWPRSHGNRFLELWPAVGMLMAQPCFAYWWQAMGHPATTEAVRIFWQAYSVWWCIFIAQAVISKIRLYCPNSMYIGDSLFARRGASRVAQTRNETFVAFVAALIAHRWSPPLGWFIAVSAICNVISVMLLEARDAITTQEIYDAQSRGRVIRDKYQGR